MSSSSEKPSTPTVPQIILTEVLSSNHHHESEHATPNSPESLSPTHFRSSSSASSGFRWSPASLSPVAPVPAATNPAPLPLTRDLLQKKNKLDNLLPNRPPFFNSTLSAVDERVTAGLGISTTSHLRPSLSPGYPTSSLSDTGLRSRRHSAQLEAIDKSKLNSPRTSDLSPFSWTYEADLPKSPSGLSFNDLKLTSRTSSLTSVTGSSVRKSESMRAYDTRTHHYMRTHPSPLRLNRHHMPTISHMSEMSQRRRKHRLVEILFGGARRVIHSRVSETKALAKLDNVDLIHCLTTDPGQLSDTTPPYSAPPEPPSKLNSSPKASMVSDKQGAIVLSKDGNTDQHDLVYRSEKNEAVPLSAGASSSTLHRQLDRIRSAPAPLYRLEGRSLHIFSPTNPLRCIAWKFIRSSYIESWMLILLLLQWFVLACVPILRNTEKTVFGAHWSHYIIFAIQIVFTIEMICKIVAYGLIIPPDVDKHAVHIIFEPVGRLIRKTFYCTSELTEDSSPPPTSFPVKKSHNRNHKAYLNSFGNAMDCVSIISYWIDFALMVHQYPYCSLFKALAALRPLRLLCIFPGTAVILRSLETGWQLLLDVSGFIFFFMLLFALAGLITFQGVFSRRCYQLIPGNEPVLVQPAQYCSGYYNGTDVFGPYNPTLDEYGYAGYHGHLCSIGQICMEVSSNNPSYGFLNFDTIFSAFLAVYTFVSLEYWTDLMYQTQDADSTTAALYYCLGVYVIAFVLIFLIFAVITSAFAKARAESSHSAFIAKRKRRALLRTAEKLDDQEEPVWMYEDPLMDYPLGFNRLRFKRKIVALVKSREFFYFGGFLVFFDMVFMCIRSAYASEDILELIDNAETAFTFVFAIEILLRMIGTTTWIQFWSVGRNKFDLFLVIATCIIQLPMIQDSPSYKYLTIFQVARLYRLFICIPRVQRLLYAALGTGESFINVLIFLVLSTALCSPIFMQMFGGDFVDFIEPNATEMRFDTFWQSFLTLIVLYTSETWTDVLYNSMKSQPHAGAIYSAIFLCFYFAFGRYIMSGLYIAVILENFELEDEFIKDYQIKRFIRRRMIKTSDTAETIFSRIFGSLYDNKPDEKQVHVHKLPDNLTASITKASMIDILTDHSEKKKVPHVFISPPRRKVTKLFGSLMFPTEKEELKTKLRVNARLIDRLAEKDDDPVEDYELIVAEENRNAQMEDVNNAKSLFFFSPRSRIRYWCKIISGSSADGKSERRNIFNWFIMACVLLSIFMVILDEPSTRKMRDGILPQSTFHTIDITLDGIFIVEILIRVIADGLLLPPGAYLRNPWNQLDICVVILNVGTVFAGSEQTPRALSTVRSLRILRLIRYFSSVKDVFIDIVHAFPLMLDALLLTFLMLIPFSVYGVNIFGGRFWLCNDESVSGRSTCVGEYLHDISSDDDMSVNILVPRAWQNPEVNFYSYDTFGLSLLQLFTLTSTEGWVDSMFSSMSTPTEPDAQPRFDWNSAMIYHSIFYVIFMIVSHGTVQLFIGVIIEKFKQRNGIATLTTGQRQYADLQRQLAQMKPTTKSFRPKSKIRAWCYDLVAKKRGVFNRLMMAAVIINIGIIASEFQNEPSWLEDFQEYAYIAFILIYIGEVIIRMLGFGWKKWIKCKWDWFDGFIASSALLLLLLRFAIPDLWTLRVERYFLVLAAFRLGQGLDALQTLYHTVAMSMRSIVSVSAVFMLVMCLFAMMFMQYFGLTKYGVYGTEHSNFRDYGNALLLLVRMTTGEAWNAVMMDYAVQAPNCVHSDNYLETDCGSPGWAYFLFNFFYIICTHIFLNLFTAVIISNFEYAYETRSRFTLITKQDLRKFKYAWAEVDPKATGFIQKSDIAKFLRHLKGRFQLRIYDDIHSIRNLQKLSKTGAVTNHQRGSLNEKFSMTGSHPNTADFYYNFTEVNKCLSFMDSNELQKRRKLYNLTYMEILDAETPRGIAFADVLTIMTYRFLNIEESLTLEPLIERLGKVDQLSKQYATEKACGVFLTLIQRKHYLHQLWLKRNEDEINKLGVGNQSSLFPDGSPRRLYGPPTSPFLGTAARRKNQSPVPRIVIDDVSSDGDSNNEQAISPLSLTIPTSPFSNFSVDSPLGADSLSVMPGTTSLPSSPISEMGDNNSGGLSPNSPWAGLSPMTRQQWLLVDGNSNLSSDQANTLMSSLYTNMWSDMLEHEQTSTR